MVSLGTEIKEKRISKCLTQLELADKIGLSRNYISDLENDRYMPSVLTLAKISKVLNLDINFLINMSEIKTKDKQKIESGDEI